MHLLKEKASPSKQMHYLPHRHHHFLRQWRQSEVKIEMTNIGINARNGDVYAVDNASVLKEKHKITVTEPDSLELSILSQSVMNDTLLETFPESKENGKVLPFLERDTSFEESIFPPNMKYLKVRNVKRSLSQRAGKSPTELYLNRRSQSVTDGQRKTSQSTIDNSTVSSFLDRGFLESKLSEQSVFSSLSNVSSITKLTSASLSSSLVLSNDAMNHAFLDDGSLKTNQERKSTTESFMEIKPKQYELSDLAERLNKLKHSMNDTSIPSVTQDDSNSTKKEKERTPNNKLIDVDVFVPE